MDEYITREELDQVLKAGPLNQRDKHSDWKGRMERIKSGEPLVLHPRDNKHTHNLRVTALQAAKEAGIRITTRKFMLNGEFKLFIWLAG